MQEPLPILFSDPWVKVVTMLQQNWASIEVDGDMVCVWFVSDSSEAFDMISFSNEGEARDALLRNGFKHFSTDDELKKFLRPPVAPFFYGEHPNGAIYSSGLYWHH